ncbi:uncharacterized protein LOC127261620 [Andrographis paniculata]|uniref:uncharacterized protein LOC127261620 n=1 Tax=Andrographis paniculata TaxID=175694 RepID=UPI0021E7B82B|nr:uncharacterized protein LOC127261620 [Andrographis paniculata]
MEITEINMITDFQVGMKSLQNPSFLSRFSSISGKEIVSQVYSFWTLGALIFAVFATFNSLIKRIKLVLIRFTVKPSAEIVDFSDRDEVCSASSEDENDGEEDNNSVSYTTSFRSRRCSADGDFQVKGSRLLFRSQGQNGHFRRRCRGGASPEFDVPGGKGKSVVKIWNGLGLRFDFDEDLFGYDSKSVVSTWKSDPDPPASGFSAVVLNSPAAAPLESPVVYLAEGNGKGGVILGGYDTRMRRNIPAIYAEWNSPAAGVAAVSTGGIGRVYVRDDVGMTVTVGDVRNVTRPLESVAESNGESWWDPDAVIRTDSG